MVFIPRPNATLHAARKAKNDEFYTRLCDVERELDHYADQFRGKAIYLPCDDYRSSAFWVYFSGRFESLGLTRLTATHYAPGGGVAHRADLTADGLTVTPLSGDGDFRSPEAIAHLKQADIVVTNPPFSLFREHVTQLIEHDKKFVLIGNPNAITYKEIWSLIQSGNLWLGNPVPRGSLWYGLEPGSEEGLKKRDATCFRYENGVPQARRPSAWFTNIEIPRRYEEIPLYRRYADDPDAYPAYANFDAIEVSKVKDIPGDYYGPMGVPITFLGRHNPDQFEIVGAGGELAGPIEGKPRPGRFYIPENGSLRRLYERIVIRRRA